MALRARSVSIIGTALLATLCPAVSAGAASATDAPCTITGTARNDVLRGTAGADVLCGLGGNDTITGLGGNDTVIGGSGNDRIDGGAGSDTLNGDAGNDTIVGGTDNDTINGGDGNDTLNGGTGSDKLSGGLGDDRESGDAGADVLWGNVGADSLSGGAGNDALQGGAGRDTVTPGSGSDQCAVDAEDSVTGVCKRDSSTPTLSVQTSPAKVNAGQVARFTWRASDPSGIQSTQASIGGPSGWITSWCGFQIVGTLISGDDRDGVYAFDCAIPALAPSQEYSIIVSASDNFGNGTDTASANFTVVGGSSDSSIPVLVDIKVLGNVEPGKSFTLRTHATDETGVAYAYTWVTRGGGVVDPFTMRFWVDYADTGSQLVQGDDKDGYWEQTFTVREDTPSGDYTIWISIGDKLGNRSYLSTQHTITVP